MAVKTFIDNSKKTIASHRNAPVTFINGEKKRLVKGVTFINGVKKVLWDATLKTTIEYIPYNQTSAMYPMVMYISKDYAIADIANYLQKVSISDPTSIEAISFYYSRNIIAAPVEENNNTVFYDTTYFYGGTGSAGGGAIQAKYSSYKTEKISISSSGDITTNREIGYSWQNGSSSGTPPFQWYSYYNAAAALDGGLLTIASKSSSSIDSSKGMKVYLGNTLKYTVSNDSTQVPSTGKKSGIVKINGTTLLGRKSISGIENTMLLYTATSYSTSPLSLSGDSNTLYFDTENNVIAIGTTATDSYVGGIEFYNSSYVLLKKYEGTTSDKRCKKILGKIAELYYVLDVPYNATSTDQTAYLRLYNSDFEEENVLILPSIDGVAPYDYVNTWVYPHTSRTNCLGIGINYGFLRIETV